MDFDVHSGIELVKKNELQRVSTIFSKLKIDRQISVISSVIEAATKGVMGIKKLGN